VIPDTIAGHLIKLTMRLLYLSRLTLVLTSFLLFHTVTLKSQDNDAGTNLIARLLGQNRDTSRIDLLLSISEELSSSESAKAFSYAREALDISLDLEDPFRTGKAYKAMAAVYTSNAMYDKSLEYLLLSLKQFESLRDTSEIARCLNELGVVHSNAGDFTNANMNLQRALDLNIKIRNYPDIARNHMNMGTNYVLFDSVEKGLSYYLVSLLIADSLGMETEKVELMNRIGHGYARTGNQEDALKHFYKVLELVADKPDDRLRTTAMVNIAQGYYIQHKYPEAMKYARDAYRISGQNNYKDLWRDAAGILSDIYAAQGDYRMSYNYLKEHKNLADTVLNAEKSAMLVKIQTLYELDKKDQENLLLRQENQKARKTLTLRTLLIILIASLVVVLALLLYMLNRMNNKQLALNKQLTEQKSELAALNDQKDKFFSFVAHNLKNPFNTIMGFAELMQRSSENKDIEKARQYSGLIYELSSQVQRVLSNLLEWSRLQRRTFECKPETLELSSLIKDVLEMNTREAARKDIHFTINDHGSVLATGDRAMITTVMQNLVSNAINFTLPAGKISLEYRVSGDQAEISITDTGIGITEENLQRLFLFDFSQAKIGSSDNSGAGLGLVICREMISKNGGTIFAESISGKGSRFTFTLPLAERVDAGDSFTGPVVHADADLTADLLAGNGNIPKSEVEEILQDLVPPFDEVSRVLSIENLERFARLVTETGERLGIIPLVNYGKSLAGLTQGHQIDQIIKMLPGFRQYMDSLTARGK
jgi:signal transduction histidine kinase